MAKRVMTEEHKAKMMAGRKAFLEAKANQPPDEEGDTEEVERKGMSHTVRSNKGNPITIENYTRGLAIKVMCTECLAHSTNPSECTSPMCPLFPFRKKSRAAYEPGTDDETSGLDEVLEEANTQEEVIEA